ncbi:MAG: hypothetical protein JNK85_10600 [Verrucomicrobiales bacterium]|nr:hypothetical protein [Verrucomicrobiales bacterium]
MHWTRREWSLALTGSLWALTSCRAVRRPWAVRETAEGITDARLAEEVALLGKRPYSELGIPMLLFGENLADTSTRAPSASQDRMGDVTHQELQAAFERLVKAWNRVHPNPTPDDIAPLLEWMAERDFGSVFRRSGV